MNKYRKRPVVIEAFQMTYGRRWDNRDWPGWLNGAWNKSSDTVGSVFLTNPNAREGEYGYGGLSILTLEGPLSIAWNDWIIQGVNGELYPCKPDIFALTYEPVEE